MNVPEHATGQLNRLFVSLLALASCCCRSAPVPTSPPAARTPPSVPAPRTTSALTELESRADCAWLQLPMWLYFDCDGSDMRDVRMLSPEPWAETVGYIDGHTEVLGVQTFGFHRYDEGEALADARAQTVARTLHQRFGMAARAQSMGAGRDEGCECGQRCYSRTVQVAVLRCRGVAPPGVAGGDPIPSP